MNEQTPKEKMKKILTALLVAFTVFALIYLLGAFQQVSFNIENWSSDARLGVAFFGGFFALFIGAFTIINESIE